MIATDLFHIAQQLAMNPVFEKAIAFLRRTDLAALPDGKTDIDGDRVFAMIQRYDTVATAAPKFEYHRTYIDVQYLASGEEVIGWAPVERMIVTEPYDEGKDVCFGSVRKGTWTPVHLQAGQLAVLWPEDGHAPKLAVGEPSAVMKIVVKVKVSDL